MIDTISKPKLRLLILDAKTKKNVTGFSVIGFKPETIKLMLEIGYRRLKERGAV